MHVCVRRITAPRHRGGGMNTKARYPSGRFASSSEFRRWLNAQYPGGASQDEQTAALYGWQAGRKEADAHVKELEEAATFTVNTPAHIQDIMRREGFKLDNLEDRWQKLVFTVYTELCECASKCEAALDSERVLRGEER